MKQGPVVSDKVPRDISSVNIVCYVQDDCDGVLSSDFAGINAILEIAVGIIIQERECVCVREVDIRRATHTHVQFECIMIKTERDGEYRE